MRQMEVNNDLAKLPTDLLLILSKLFAPKAKKMMDLQKAISPLVTGEQPDYVKSWTLKNYKSHSENTRKIYCKIHEIGRIPKKSKCIVDLRNVSREERDTKILFHKKEFFTLIID